jgi:glycosyltransferase involved in cell wall biosynthesis
MKELENSMVSVNMITYGHENYISQAIEGILMQETNFEYDLIIADDCSPDHTQEIVERIIKNHPKGYKIKYFRHKKNIGMQANAMFAFEQCQGKYIAICEGDDYWTDPLKLQKQVDFLETNSEFTFSMGRVDIFVENTGEVIKMKEHVNPNKEEAYTLKDYIKNPFSQTSSFVFKNSTEPFPEWFHHVHAGDQSLVVIKTGVNGKIKYHQDCFSIYRVNENSVSFDVDLKKLKSRGEFFLSNINEYTRFKYNYIIVIRRYINRLYCSSRSTNLIVRHTSLIAYRLLLNLVKKI